jgi:hypothetical protein
MEGQSEVPLKVCPNCSVASRTDAETCPSCGKPYMRRGLEWPRRLEWRWWFAIPIVAAAFLIGYFGLSELIDDEPKRITAQEATAIEADSSRSAVVEQLGEPASETAVGEGQTCLQYEVTDAPEPTWLFCFREDKLVSSSPVPE